MNSETDSRLPGDGQEESLDEINILDLLIVVAAGKKLIIAITLVFGILAAVVALNTPETFTAKAVVLPPMQQSSTAAALMGQLGGLAGFAGQRLGISNPTDAYIGVLESRTVADEMIRQLNLLEVYEAETLTDARKKLKNVSKIESLRSGMIDISVTDLDPQVAADIANAYVEILNSRNNELAVTEASQRRVFFEKQWEKEKNNLAEAEWDLKNFQEQKGIVRVDSQVEAALQSAVRLQADITAAETILERLKTGATRENAEVQRQEAALSKLRVELRRFEEQDDSRNQGNPLIPTSMVPETGLEYARKLREVKYREALYEVMARQYEAARIDEANESSLIQVVDAAVPPEIRSAPKRTLYVLVGLVAGGMLGVFVVFLRHAVSDPSQEEKMTELFNLLSFGLLRKNSVRLSDR